VTLELQLCAGTEQDKWRAHATHTPTASQRPAALFWRVVNVTGLFFFLNQQHLHHQHVSLSMRRTRPAAAWSDIWWCALPRCQTI